MWSVGRPGSKSAMPRLPRVISTAAAARRARAARGRPARARARCRRSGCRAPARPPTRSACTPSCRGTAAGRSASRRGRAATVRSWLRRGESRRPTRRRDQPAAVVGDDHRVRAADGAQRRAPRTPRAILSSTAVDGGAIDAHDLLLGGMDAAGEDPRLDRRAVARRAAARAPTSIRRDLSVGSRRRARLRRGRRRRPGARAPPSAATLLAALPAPPGTISVES